MKFTKEVLRDALPGKFRGVITDETVDFLNKAETDELIVDEFRDNFLTYSKVLTEGKYSLEQYVNAIKFVTFKLLDYTDSDAWRLVFPDRWDRVQTDHAHDPDKANRLASSFANKFKTTKLVTQIMQQTIVPSYIYNAPLFQSTLLDLVKIVQTSKSDVARVQAAGHILNHTKPPEEKSIQLNVGLKSNETISDLREVMEEFAQQQLGMLDDGTAIDVISEAKILPSKYEEG